MEFKFVKIAVYVPSSHAKKVREALAENGAGRFNKYDYCSFTTKGTGRFRGLKGSNPFLGKSGQIEKVSEERIETICLKKHLKKVLAVVKKAHPYEEPAIDIFPMLNE